MNENEIDVLLDHFVGALDSTESASVAQKINSLPLWSKTYKQINLVFGSLNAIKEEDSKRPAPEGLASKTLQKILEQKKTQQAPTEFIAQKSDALEQTDRPTSRKRLTSVKPSVLAFSACAGFLFIVTLAALTPFFGNSNSVITHNPTTEFAGSSNNSTDFAVTGSSQQPSSSFYFCSDGVSDSANQIPYSYDDNSFAVNASEQLVDLSGSSLQPVVKRRTTPVKMDCPDNSFIVISPQPEGRPIFLVQPHHFPGELQNIQNVVNQQNDNFAVPVNYQK